ncbi:hypothetical protein RO3G_10596 [Rhizopus delemar RA 99-880]|uniref:Uncharacterized protein n=1 Tax=Rhizopus delemar (strain RA 99-880 / ATCC MYA-4621 / FGSC 9543 / NRRL 43880) TaxID=246409 RepID=I1CBQ6_RHIO9|nr:hypothetical protein RO3G_10596 [Rhizopus delemar RA 99-880]|eukprot:EIE85886.1 hypothetical protein RO3G_10596 [Rhizopus delemar RA 99-880]
MVSAPTDDYIKWAQKAYPDEKTKLFPMSPERLCLFIKRSLPFPPRPGEERKRLLRKWQEESSLLEKNESLKNELSQKEKEIDRLNAILDQYRKVLIDQPEQECFILL